MEGRCTGNLPVALPPRSRGEYLSDKMSQMAAQKVGYSTERIL